MALKDLALATDGDLLINDAGDFEIIDAVKQGVQIRLRWIKGEWVFNTAMGTPYFETILVKTPNRVLIEKALRDQILAVDGVTGGREYQPDKGHKEPDAACVFYCVHNRGRNRKRGGAVPCRITE